MKLKRYSALFYDAVTQVLVQFKKMEGWKLKIVGPSWGCVTFGKKIKGLKLLGQAHDQAT